MLARVFTAVYWSLSVIWAFVCLAVIAVTWLVTAPFDRRRAIAHAIVCWWGATYTWCNPAWRVRVFHRERIALGTTYVIVANHQSLLDILALFRLFRHFKWVSKRENFLMPAVGWIMYLTGYISLRRGDSASIRAMLDECRATLRRGSSVLIFPEGTRSEDGEIRAFTSGAFKLAKELGVPIAPVVVDGTRNALPKGRILLTGPHDITVRALEPIAPADFGDDSSKALAGRVRAMMAEELARMRAE